MVLFIIIIFLIFHSIVNNEKRLFQIYAFNHISEHNAYDINYQGLSMKHTYKMNGKSLVREYLIIENPTNELTSIDKLNMIIQFHKDDKFDLIVKTKFNSERNVENWSLDKYMDDRIIEVFQISNAFRFAIRILIININPENGYRLFTMKISTSNSVNFYDKDLLSTHHNTEQIHKNLLVYPKSLLTDKYFKPNITDILVNTVVSQMNENKMLLLKKVNFKFGENYIFYKHFENKTIGKSIKSHVRIREKLSDGIIIDIDFLYHDKINTLNINGYSIFNNKIKLDIDGKHICKNPSKKDPPLCDKEIDKPGQFQCFNRVNSKLLSSKRNPKKKNVCECRRGFYGNNCLYSSRCLLVKLKNKQNICLKAVNFGNGGNPGLKEIEDVRRCFKGSRTLSLKKEIAEKGLKKLCSCDHSNHTGMFCELNCKAFCSCEKCKYNRGNVICNCPESSRNNYDIVIDLRSLICFLIACFLILIIIISKKISKMCRSSPVHKYTYEKSKYPVQQYNTIMDTLYDETYYLEKSQNDLYEPHNLYDFRNQSTLNISVPTYLSRSNEPNLNETFCRAKGNCTINTSSSYKINWKKTNKKYNTVGVGYNSNYIHSEKECDEYTYDILSDANNDDKEPFSNPGFYELNNNKKKMIKQNIEKKHHRVKSNAAVCKSWSDLYDN